MPVVTLEIRLPLARVKAVATLGTAGQWQLNKKYSHLVGVLYACGYIGDWSVD